MHVALRCRTCEHAFTLTDEPRTLTPLTCPGCGAAPPVQASEDFASAVEDVLAQLWHVGRTYQLTLSLDADRLPPAFCPESAGMPRDAG